MAQIVPEIQIRIRSFADVKTALVVAHHINLTSPVYPGIEGRITFREQTERTEQTPRPSSAAFLSAKLPCMFLVLFCLTAMRLL